MADYNLFPEDICLAVKNMLSTPVITVMENSVSKVVPVYYVYPEARLADFDTPSIVIFEVDPIQDNNRKESGERLLDNSIYNEIDEMVSADVRSFPEPFLVYVYIRLKFKFDAHRDIVRKQIYSRFQIPHGGITVNGYPLLAEFGGEVPSLLDSAEEFATKEYKVAQWYFKIPTWFDVHQRKTLNIARDVIINEPTIGRS